MDRIKELYARYGRKFLIFAAIVILGLMALIGSAQSQGLHTGDCHPAAKLSAMLQTPPISEQVQYQADARGGLKVLVYASKVGATWSLVLLRPGGMACLTAFGRDWVGPDGLAPEGLGLLPGSSLGQEL